MDIVTLFLLSGLLITFKGVSSFILWSDCCTRCYLLHENDLNNFISSFYFQQIFFSTSLFCTKHVLKYLFSPYFFISFKSVSSSAASSGGPLRALIIIPSLLLAVLSFCLTLSLRIRFLAFAYSPRTQDQEWKPQLAGVCLRLQSGSGEAEEWNSRDRLLLLLLSISCSLFYTEIQGKRKSPLHVKSTFEFFH